MINFSSGLDDPVFDEKTILLDLEEQRVFWK